MINVKVEIFEDKINELIQAQKMSIESTTNDVLEDIKTSAVVPYDTGNLQDSSSVDLSALDNGVTHIYFDTPYARRLYWHPEFNFRRDKNANAQGKWMQDYVDGEKVEFIKEKFKNHLKSNAKGLIK
ncbi:Minor capsid protein [Clostridium cavendishii DSM 21758]|uniref:Minor capsid protein n=1 Tax=Clostridium cavendishii DSM 21758 TaxID=1121302 RepID=A0A1M6S4Z5_9CLOT|nr:minor capsid protein [Clostridium cavendishii]SHK39588.1 Minor capsid protein [Clostridium cavendishii DSM 21758]